jgi:hypothetical protein
MLALKPRLCRASGWEAFVLQLHDTDRKQADSGSHTCTSKPNQQAQRRRSSLKSVTRQADCQSGSDEGNAFTHEGVAIRDVRRRCELTNDFSASICSGLLGAPSLNWRAWYGRETGAEGDLSNVLDVLHGRANPGCTGDTGLACWPWPRQRDLEPKPDYPRGRVVAKAIPG